MGETPIIGGVSRYETMQFFFRKHWTQFFRIFLLGGAIFLATLFIIFLLGLFITYFKIISLYPFFIFMSLIIFIAAINIFFLQLFNFYFDFVLVTNCRIIVVRKTVFLRNDNDAIDLTKIQDIGVVERGIMNNYLNYGTLIIALSSSSPPITISNVPNPHYYLEQLNRIKREYILQRQEKKSSLSSKIHEKQMEYLQDIDKL